MVPLVPERCICSAITGLVGGDNNRTSGIIVNCFCGTLQCFTTINPLKDFSVENLSCHALKPNKP